LRRIIGCREIHLEVYLNAQRSRLGYLLLAPAVLSAAVGVAVVLGAQSGTRDQAVAALYSPDPWVRLEAVDQLAQLGTTADADLVIEVLYDSDPVVREHAQAAVWVLWSRSGDAEVDRLLESGIQRMQDGEMSEAVEVFTRVTERKPEFAEGWNKRATAYYLMGEFDRSLKDCDEVIKRNPQHFGALSGYGMIYTRLGELEKALRYFERALEINPNLTGVAESIRVIRHKLRQSGKQDI
jgi:tetratricopeptide (TPR) repeat protein